MRRFVSHDRLVLPALIGAGGGIAVPWSPLLGGAILAVWVAILVCTIAERRRVFAEEAPSGRAGPDNRTPHDEAKLCRLLGKAARAVRRIPDGGFSKYDSGRQMAAFILECRNAILNRTSTLEQRRALWLLFAPTCDWDDIGGEMELANKILELVDGLYRDEILKSPPQDTKMGRET